MNFSTSKNRSPSVGQRKYNHPARFNTYYKTLEDDGRAFYTADKLHQQEQTMKTPAKLPIEWSHENALNAGFSKDPVVWRTPSMTVPTAESENGSPDINEYLNDLKARNGDLGIFPKRKFYEDGMHHLMYKLKKGKDEVDNQVKQMSRIEVSLMESKLNLSQKDIGKSLLHKNRMNKAKKMFGFGFGYGLGGKEFWPISNSKKAGAHQKMMAKGSSLLHPTLSHTKNSVSTFDESRTRLPSSLSFCVDHNKRIFPVESEYENIFDVQRADTTIENTIETEDFSVLNELNKTNKEGYYSVFGKNASFIQDKNGYNLFSQEERGNTESKRMSLMSGGSVASRILRKGTKSVDDKKRPIVIHSKEGLEKQKILSGKNLLSQPATSNRAKCFGNLKDWFDTMKISGKPKEASSRRRGYDLIPIPKNKDMRTRITTNRTLEDEEESCLSVTQSSARGNEGDKSNLMRNLDQVKKREIKPLNMAPPQLTITWDTQESPFPQPQREIKPEFVAIGGGGERGERGERDKFKSKNEKMIDLDLQIKKKMFSQKLNVNNAKIKKHQSPLRTAHSIIETDIDGWSMSNPADLNRKESLFKDDLYL